MINSQLLFYNENVITWEITVLLKFKKNKQNVVPNNYAESSLKTFNVSMNAKQKSVICAAWTEFFQKCYNLKQKAIYSSSYILIYTPFLDMTLTILSSIELVSPSIISGSISFEDASIASQSCCLEV